MMVLCGMVSFVVVVAQEDLHLTPDSATSRRPGLSGGFLHDRKKIYLMRLREFNAFLLVMTSKKQP